MQNIGDNFQ